MGNRRATTWAILLLAAGCARERDAAPKALDDLAHLAFSAFEDPALVEHADGIASWLADEAESDAAWDGLRLTNLAAAEVSGIPFPPGTDLSVHEGLANAAVSEFGVRDHATLIVERDQTWTDPKSFERYQRTILEGSAEDFAAGQGLVRTDNTIVKSGAFGVVIPYALRKDYRWIERSDGTHAILARAWLDQKGCSDNGKNCVNQSWGLEVFHAASVARTRRLYAVWLEVRTEADALISLDAKIGLMAKGNQDILDATDEELATR